MGSGYRTFASGEVLTSSNVMNYLMEQTVMTFASTAARDAAVTAPEEGMLTYLQDVDKFTAYSGSAWVDYGYLGAWVTFSPSWTSTGSAPSIGNGTINARYTRLGRTIHFAISVTTGTTTNYGTGSYSFGLPFTAVSGVEQYTIVRAYDSSANLAYIGQGVIGTGATSVLLQCTNGGALASVTNTSPFTGATGDGYRVTGTYETA